MYTKDKSNRITLRLNDEQFEFVKQNADFIGVSPSEFLRMVVNASMATTKAAIPKIEAGLGLANDKTNSDDKARIKSAISKIEEGLEGLGRANDKTDSNDIV